MPATHAPLASHTAESTATIATIATTGTAARPEHRLARLIKAIILVRASVPLTWGLIGMFAPSVMPTAFIWPEMRADVAGGDGNAYQAMLYLNQFWSGDDAQQAIACILAVLFGPERLHWWIGFFAVPHNVFEIWLSNAIISWCNANPDLRCWTGGMYIDFAIHVLLGVVTTYYLLARRDYSGPKGSRNREDSTPIFNSEQSYAQL